MLRQLTHANIAELIDTQPISSFQLRAVLICLLLVVLDGFDTQCIAFVAPSISVDLHLARSDLGPVFSAGMVGTMLGSLFLAPLGDRYGRKPIILIATACMALFAALTMLASSVGQLVLLRVLTGLGLGMVLPNAIALTIEYSPQRSRTLLTTTVVLGISFGGIIGGLLSAKAIPVFGWRSVFLIGGLLALLMCPIAWALLPESIRFLGRKPRDSRQIASILHRIDPSRRYEDVRVVPTDDRSVRQVPVWRLFDRGRAAHTLLLWCVFIANLFLMNFMINWLPSVLHDAGLTLTDAILAQTAFNVGGIVGGLVLAWCVDRWGASAVLTPAYLLTTVAIASVGSFDRSPVALILAIFFSGVGVIGAFSGINVLSGTIYPTVIRTTGVGWAFGVGRVGSVLGPIAGGLIFALHWTPKAIFLFGAVPALLATTGVFFIARLSEPGLAGGTEPHGS